MKDFILYSSVWLLRYLAHMIESPMVYAALGRDAGISPWPV